MKTRQDFHYPRESEGRENTISVHSQLGPGEEVQFEEDLLELAPFVRSLARALSKNRETALDLAQETLLRAWSARSTFKNGTNLKAWLCIILRNKFISDQRRAWRNVEWDEKAADRISVCDPEQAPAVDLSDTVRSLRRLSPEQREALTLVGAGGFSYKDAARICNCAVGTIKSRVARARTSLAFILEHETSTQSSLPEAHRAADEILAELMRLAAGAGRVGLPSARKKSARTPSLKTPILARRTVSKAAIPFSFSYGQEFAT
jgi:RNA polymerase sigma-70 factor, ECF subfamily